jgi:hypothetical protein
MNKNFPIGHGGGVMFDDAAIAKAETADDSVAGLEAFRKGSFFDTEKFLSAQKDFEKFDFEATGTADATFEILGKSVFGDAFATVTPAPKAKGSDRFQSTTAFRKRLHEALPEGAPAWLSAFCGGSEQQARLEIRRALKTAFGK